MLNADQNLPAEVDWHREPATDYAAPWEAFLNYVEEIERVHWITQSALRNINGLGRLSEILHRSKGAEGEALIAEAVQLEDAINGEVGRGTPLLLAHSAVAVWAALETTIPSFVAHWLFENPETLQESLSRRSNYRSHKLWDFQVLNLCLQWLRPWIRSPAVVKS